MDVRVWMESYGFPSMQWGEFREATQGYSSQGRDALIENIKESPVHLSCGSQAETTHANMDHHANATQTAAAL